MNIGTSSKQENLETLNAKNPLYSLLEMISGNWVSQSIYAAAKLGIADLLKDEPQQIDQLAQAIEVDVQALYRLMRNLVSLGVFKEIGDKYFSLTPIGEYLQKDHPKSLRSLVILWGEEQYLAWSDIIYSIKTGKSAYQQQNQVDFFDYLEENAEAAQTFNNAMTEYSRHTHTSVLEAYDFSEFKQIVDVGGGHGNLILSILKANPHLKGILFDAPHAMEGAKKNIQQAGLADRCEVVAGDFFQSVPSGGDVYILSVIIHDWNDEHSISILKNCRQAIAKNGKILLVEMVIPSHNKPFFGKRLDLHMLVMHGGRERTETEYETLLEQSGFKLTNIITTKFLPSIIEAVAV